MGEGAVDGKNLQGVAQQAVFDRAHDTEHGAEDMTAVVLPMKQDAGVEVIRHASID